MKQANGSITVLSGPSGVGKDSVIKLLESYSEVIIRVPGYTTRPKRSGEIDKVDYNFVSREEFALLRETEEFLDCTELKGNLYGTPLSEYQQCIEEGKHGVVHLRAESALLLQRRVPNVRTVFIMPPSLSELEKRLRGRGSTEEDIALRIKMAVSECSVAINFDFIVINYSGEVEDTVRRIHNYIQS